MADFAPSVLFQIGSFPITNTILNTLLVDGVLIGSAFYIKNHIKKIPGMFQNILELVINTFYDLTEQIAGNTNARKIFPWFMTFFLFILISNWSGLIPGHGSIGLKPSGHAVETEATSHDTTESSSEATSPVATDDHTADTTYESTTADTHTDGSLQETKTEKVAEEAAGAKASSDDGHLIPIMRNATSEINVTLALALISLVATHILAIRSTGFKDYISRFISFNPILLFVGMLELVSEFTKIISLSFRLFGNIFAGEVVLTTISGLLAFFAPVPFMLLEVIVGLVQALVFAMLTMVFMSVLMTPHHAEEHAKAH